MKAKLREDRQEAMGPNDIWAMDFVHDQLAAGKKLRILTIVDIHSRFSPATDPCFIYRDHAGCKSPSKYGMLFQYIHSPESEILARTVAALAPTPAASLNRQVFQNVALQNSEEALLSLRLCFLVLFHSAAAVSSPTSMPKLSIG